jgi:VanZ family protein
MLAWALIVLALTLVPYNFTLTPEEEKEPEFKDPIAGLISDAVDAVLNVLLFLPLGVLLVQKLRPGIRRFQRMALTAGAAGFAFSATIEILQLFLPTRSTTVLDVITNTAGAIIGARVAWILGSTTDLIAELRSRIPRPVRIALPVGCAVLIVLASGAVQYGSRLINWDEEFPLLVGNERGGGRLWQGRVLRLEISDVSIPREALLRFAAGDSPVLPAPILAGLNRLKLVERGPQRWLQTPDPPREVARRIRASGALTVRLTCVSDSPYQEGPVRIVSYSTSPLLRNFTIGQEGPDMVVRLRTPTNGKNGMRIPLVVEDVFATPGVRDIVVTYGASTLSAAVAGSNQVTSIDFGPGTILASLYLHLPEPKHFGYLQVLYYGVVFVVQIGVLRFLRPDTPAAVAFIWLAGLTFVLEATLAFAAPRAFEWTNVGMSLATGSVVLIVIWAMFGRYWTRPWITRAA